MNKTNRSAPQQDLEDISASKFGRFTCESTASNPVDSPINVKGNFSGVEYNFNPILLRFGWSTLGLYAQRNFVSLLCFSVIQILLHCNS